MALVRFRLPASGSAAVSPAMQSYTHTQATRRPLPTSDSTALATQAYTPDASDHGVAGDSHHVQFVSAALTTGTMFKIGNTIKLCVQGLEPNANCNQALQCWVGVYSNDGGTLRQTLRGKITAAEFNTSLRSVFLSTTVAADYTTVSGDRLVVEIGSAGTPAGGSGVQGHNASIRWGANGAGGDLAENDTQTGTTLNPWFEIQTTEETIVTPDPVTAGWGAVAPTLLLGALTLAPTPVVAAWSVATPSMQLGAVTRTPDPVVGGWSIATPTVSSGQAATPDAVIGGWTVTIPTLGIGVRTLTPTAIPAGYALADPTIARGPVTLTPDGVPATLGVPVPSLLTGFVLAPTPGSAAWTVAAPTVTQQFALAPSPVVSAWGMAAPAVTPGARTITVATVVTTWVVGTPYVDVGTITDYYSTCSRALRRLRRWARGQ